MTPDKLRRGRQEPDLGQQFRNDHSMTSASADDPVMPLAGDQRARRHTRPRGSRRLRLGSVLLDLVVVAVGWLIGMALGGSASGMGTSATTLAAALVVHWLAYQRAGLYRSRITAIRLEEMRRVLRTTLVVAGILVLLGRLTLISVPIGVAALATSVTLPMMYAERAVLRAWLLSQRAAGRFCRSVVIVGTNDETAAMYDILSQHPELGFDVVGVYGDQVEAERLGLGGLWKGDEFSASSQVQAGNITGAIVSTSSLDADSLNRVTRDLLAIGAHVHLSSRLAGFASHRLRAQSIAYEPLIYLERLQLAGWQTLLKRTIDLVIASIALVPASIIIGVFAMAVKIEDRGPAIFRQTRIGRGGQPFDVLKLRTMVVDAEARLAALRAEANERSGPLFKMEHDPRFTRVGRFMDLTSINELPQLWNVIRGEMSIVGPRPALPSEYAEFDTALQTRTVVQPGITGLWQVEARDNPSFDAYRRFDLHYVENWSPTLDIVILIATAESVLARLLRMARGIQAPTPGTGAKQRNPPRLRVASTTLDSLSGSRLERRVGWERRGEGREETGTDMTSAS